MIQTLSSLLALAVVITTKLASWQLSLVSEVSGSDRKPILAVPVKATRVTDMPYYKPNVWPKWIIICNSSMTIILTINTTSLDIRVKPIAKEANASSELRHLEMHNWGRWQLIYRADSRFEPSQWETSLQSNAVSHWLGTSLESALSYGRILQLFFLLINWHYKKI